MSSTGAQVDALSEKLRVLRSRLADHERVPAYFIFTDASLRDMANLAPITRDAFRQIRGVGPRKLERYGQEFIDVIRAHISSLSNQTANSELESISLDGAEEDSTSAPPIETVGQEAHTKQELEANIASAMKPRRVATILMALMTWTVMASLWVADELISKMLYIRSDERTVRPTERIEWPYELKKKLLIRQNSTCAYCGHRQFARALEIDHMFPVVRGGSNDRENLQLLCHWCNLRKGMQSDEEFRARYALLLPSKPLPLPRRRISQREFSAATQRTSQSDTVRKFRKSRFYTKREKILTGCAVVYAFTALVILVPLYYWGFEGLTLGLPAIICGFAVGAGIWFRAYMTGAIIEEE